MSSSSFSNCSSFLRQVQVLVDTFRHVSCKARLRPPARAEPPPPNHLARICRSTRHPDVPLALHPDVPLALHPD
eukprot:139883-Pleurochrysis_carterae.AAC.1